MSGDSQAAFLGEGKGFPLTRLRTCGRIGFITTSLEELGPGELPHFRCYAGVGGDGCSLVVDGGIGDGGADDDLGISGDVSEGAVKVVTCREERAILRVGRLSTGLLPAGLRPWMQASIDVAGLPEVIFKMIGGHAANLDREPPVDGILYLFLFCLDEGEELNLCQYFSV